MYPRMMQRVGSRSEVQWNGEDGWSKLVPFLETEGARSQAPVPQGVTITVIDTSNPVEKCLNALIDWLNVGVR